MARASTYTQLPLDTWAKIMGIDPWSFNQFNFPGPKSAQCSDVVFQYQWQKDHLSREEIADAIASAERMIADELRYWPAPHYEVDEVVMYPRPHQRNLYGYAGTVRGEWKTVQLNWHRVISGGVFNRTFLNNTIGITLSSPDGDSVNELFTATVTVPAGTSEAEIALYFTAADRNSEPIAETWRVRPVSVSVSGTIATITGHATLLVKPDLTFEVDAAALEAATAANYVTQLECYRVFTDTTATADNPYQGVAIWKDIPGCAMGCTFSIKELCLGESNNPQGTVFASFGQPCSWPFPTREPDRLEVNYVAGLALENGQMQPEMAKAVTYLATSLLANEKCGCDRSNRILAYWRAPVLSFEDDANKARGFSKAAGGGPFPATRGGQWAWQRVKRFWRDVEAVSL